MGNDDKMGQKIASAAALRNNMPDTEKTAYKYGAAVEKEVEIEDLDEEGKDMVSRSLRKKIYDLVRHFFHNCTHCNIMQGDPTLTIWQSMYLEGLACHNVQ